MLNNSKTKELLIIYLHLNIFFQIAYLQDLASIKGVKGGNVTLSCTVPETTGDNLPTISWEKVSTSGLSTRVASSFNGVSFIKYLFQRFINIFFINLHAFKRHFIYMGNLLFVTR